MWSVLLSADELDGHEQLDFTRRYGTVWEGADHRVQLQHAGVVHALAKM